MEDHPPSESSLATGSFEQTSNCSNLAKFAGIDGGDPAEAAVDFDCSSAGNPDVMDESGCFLADADNMATTSVLTATVPDSCATTGSTNATAVGVGSDVHEGIDRLLVRHRNEIMFELRRLQFGERPVTGDSGTVRRQAVDRLVSRFTRQTSQLQTTLQQVQPEAEQHVRPEQVIVEVNALVEQRPVSSILQSTAFRASIERSLRGALNSLRRDSGAATSPMVTFARQQRRAAVEAAAAAAAAVTSHSPSPSPSVAERAADGDRLSIAAASSISGDEHQPHVLPANPWEMEADRTAAWLQQNPLNIPPPQPLDQNQIQMNEVIEQMHHDNVISEISELIQAQLVTSALDGPIREVLERQMRNRVETTGMDGVRVQQILRQLPRNHQHRRNDFWEHGLVAPGQGQGQQNDNVDNISVISATAAVAVPQSYTRSTMALSHDVRALQRQVTELKTMLQLSFDLQLDIQRSIRQEVAAALSATLASSAASGGHSSSSAACSGILSGARSSRPPGGSCGNCLICLDKPVDTVIYQCGHMCLCYTCGMLLRQRSSQCPVCRAPIRDIIRAYHS